ncbi:MAG: SUMF1/EgtB/PvdO family nonheme iron enzyme [Verrucomicrobiota bacterium]
MSSITVVNCPTCGAQLPPGADPSTGSCPHCSPAPTPFPLPEKIAASLAFSHVAPVRAGNSFQYCRAERSNGERFGVYVLPARLGGITQQDTQAFFPDASNASTLRHPNIVSVFHFGELDGHYLLVTEWLEGWTLDDRFRENQISWDQGETIGSSLAEALRHAHEQGIAHRALNPAAILQTSGGDYKILGFGLANLLLPAWEEQLAASGLTIRDYLAPELIQPGLVAGNHLSDIFGLGRILYRCFCGELPSGAFASMPSQKTGLPTFIDDAVLGAMHYEPEQRPQSIAQLVQELAGHLTRVPTSSHSEEEHQKIRRFKLRSDDHGIPLLRWILATLVAVTILGGLYHITLKYLIPNEKEESQQVNQNSSLDVKAILALIARARLLHEDGQFVPAEAIIKEVATTTPVSEPVLKETLSALEDWGEYELALKLGQAYVDRDVSEGPKKQNLIAIFEERKNVIVPFLEFRALANTARDRGDDFLENEALQEAIALIPDDKEVSRRIKENPVFVYTQIMDGISALKSLHPDYDSWRIHVHVDRKGSRVDLSDNIGLNNINPLAGLPINELDISRTRTTDLTPLAEVPLKVLRIDSTPVRDISPIKNAPLEVFSFNHAPITDSSVLEEMTTLKASRGGHEDTKFKKFAPPEPGENWDNPLGMRFRPIGSGESLMAVWETRYADFLAYSKSSNLAIIPNMLSFSEDKWIADGATWKKPGYETDENLPVVGVSQRDITNFCKWLTEKDLKRGALKKGQSYRLPTDSEWNLAIQAKDNILLSPKTRSLQPTESGGLTSVSPSGALDFWEGIPSEQSALPKLATANAGGENDWIGPIGRFADTNGFYDLHGNAREWCSDATDHQLTNFIVRGSDFTTGNFSPETRSILDQEARYSDLGFRVVLQLKPNETDLPLITQIKKKDWEAAAEIALPDAVNHDNDSVRAAARDYLVLQEWIDDPTRRESDLLNDSRLKKFGDSTYFLARIPLPWGDAKEIADATGGHLAVITSPEEQKWIEHNFLVPPDAQTLWLGASARGPQWNWITDNPWEFQHREIPETDSSTAALILAPTTLNKGGTHHYANWLPDNPLEAHAFLIEWHTPNNNPVATPDETPLADEPAPAADPPETAAPKGSPTAP